MATNVPAPTYGPLGFIGPSGPAILAGVQADYNLAFRGSLNFALTTPQGQLTSSTAALVANSNAIFVYMTQQTDPNYAVGRWQDAIARIYFLEREPAEPTVVQAKCSGLTGVIIPVGALAQAADNNIYQCTEAGTISAGGFVVVPFACKTPGPIPCAAGTLTKIYQAVTGWDSVTNESEGVVGRSTETRYAFEARRRASVALNSRGSLQAIQGAVLDVPGVLDAYTTENDLGTTAVVGGVTLAAHSLYVAAVGGTDAAVAAAIWSKKAPGCDYNGGTTVVVTDTSAGYAPPFPSYNVKFQRPSSLPILYAIDITNNPQLPSDALQQIQAAIISAFAGDDGGPRATIGAVLYASRYVTPVAALGTWVQIRSLKIGSNNTSSAVFIGSISGTTLTVSSVTSGTIAVGQTISDTTGNVAVGSTIVSGSGLSWVVSQSQTVGSETFTASVPNLDSVSVRINQVPTISANDIYLTITTP